MSPTLQRVEKAGILLAVTLPFLATLYAIVLLWNRMVSWTDIALMLSLYIVSGLGITMGFHRMLVHRSFEAHPVLRFILLACGCLALEGTPIVWGATHIKHHAHSDTEEDPHSPLRGFFHAHLGWLFRGMQADRALWGKRFDNDRMAQFFSTTFFFWVGLGLLIPYLIGGWHGLLWGGFVRIFITHHVTWSVNSISHIFGGRMFDTPDTSRNNFVVGVLAMGEGWHNNHHAFPRSAFHGLLWWQIDLSGYLIRLFEKLGWVKNVWRIPQETLEARLIKDARAMRGEAAEKEETRRKRHEIRRKAKTHV